MFGKQNECSLTRKSCHFFLTDGKVDLSFGVTQTVTA